MPRPSVLTVAVIALLASCGETTADPARFNTLYVAETPPACDVTDTWQDFPAAPTDREIEAIVTALSGIVEDAQPEGEDIAFDAPNYAGAYGDFQGGIVAAVVDCSLIEPDKIAALAGGPDRLTLIQVPYSFDEINTYRDELVRQMDNTGIDDFGVSIDSTTDGRYISVALPDPDGLPSDFGEGVPDDVYVVVPGGGFGEE